MIVPALLEMLASDDLDARYGACQALGSLKGKAAAAMEPLTEALGSEDVWLRIQACYALAGIEEAARPAAPHMLRLALTEDPADPRGFTQRYLAFCLFYPGGALRMRGVLRRTSATSAGTCSSTRRPSAPERRRARARAAGTIYKILPFERLVPLLPRIVESVRTPSPSGVMFANGIRLAGLDLLSERRAGDPALRRGDGDRPVGQAGPRPASDEGGGSLRRRRARDPSPA